MQKWEYLLVEFDPISHSDERQYLINGEAFSHGLDLTSPQAHPDIQKFKHQLLNHYGLQGWELVTQRNSSEYTFKRLLG